MKLIEFKLTVHKAGYVKDEDELGELCDKAEAVIERYIDGLRSSLESSGFTLEKKD